MLTDNAIHHNYWNDTILNMQLNSKPFILWMQVWGLRHDETTDELMKEKEGLRGRNKRKIGEEKGEK